MFNRKTLDHEGPKRDFRMGIRVACLGDDTSRCLGLSSAGTEQTREEIPEIPKQSLLHEAAGTILQGAQPTLDAVQDQIPVDTDDMVTSLRREPTSKSTVSGVSRQTSCAS